ncbi:MAG: hypothetical protein JSR80_03200 [Verrucomicrobia bacterium]|nr:hypothetical protein [Verrucomicrobiota bacterium]
MKWLMLLLLAAVPVLARSAIFPEVKDSLTKIELALRVAGSDEQIVKLLGRFQKEMVRYLAEAKSADFVVELKELEPLIDAIGYRSNLFHYRFRPYRFSHAFTVEDMNGQIICFTNTYLSNEPLDEQKKARLFFLEMNSYEEWGTHPRQLLNRHTFPNLQPGLVYNFVVTSDGLVYSSPDERDPNIYFTTEEGISIKRITSPNHTILAGNQPVLSAGTFVIWQVEDRQLIFVSNDSGHFRPDYESLKIFKDTLIRWGIAPQQIICMAVEVNFDHVLERLQRRFLEQTAQAIPK